MDKNTVKHSKQDVPQLGTLKKELKRERYKRRFRRLLRSTVNALIVVAAIVLYQRNSAKKMAAL